MLTPLDLNNKEFKKKLLGYSSEEVDDFLDKVIEDYEKLYKENIEFKDKIGTLNEAIQHYKAIEEALQNTLMAAQQTGDDIKKNAYQKSENIIKEAELRAQKMINDASQEVLKIHFEYDDTKKKFHIFRAKVETLLMSQMEVLKGSNEADFQE